MSFIYPDAIETKSEKISGPKMVTRKVKFRIKGLTNEGWLIVTAEKLALKYDGYIKRYHFRSCIDTSVIIFCCPKDKWLRLHASFVGETNGKIEQIRCSRL